MLFRSLVAFLDGLPGGPDGTDASFANIEAELGIEVGTLRALSSLTRDDFADAMQSVGVDHRLEELVRYATPEELQGLAEGVSEDAEIQALIDQGGSLLTLPQVIGVVNALGLDYSQINSLVSLDPDAVRESAETGAIYYFALGASMFEVDVPDVGAALDRLSVALDRNIGDVTLAGADTAVGDHHIHMMIETVGGTHTLNGVEDQVSLSLGYDPDGGVYADGLSARDFISIGQNVLAMYDVDGDAEVGLATDAFMRMTFNLEDGSSPFTDLGRGEITATVTVTDLQENTASASTSDYVDPDFTLDESADSAVFDGVDLTINVASDDLDTNREESEDVTVTLTGIDSDAASVTVTVSGDGREDVSATATPTGSSWSVDLDLSGFDHGQWLDIEATVTDEAGNSHTVTAVDAIELDKVADGGIAASVSFVDDWSDDSPAGVLNLEEAGEGAVGAHWGLWDQEEAFKYVGALD